MGRYAHSQPLRWSLARALANRNAPQFLVDPAELDSSGILASIFIFKRSAVLVSVSTIINCSVNLHELHPAALHAWRVSWKWSISPLARGRATLRAAYAASVPSICAWRGSCRLLAAGPGWRHRLWHAWTPRAASKLRGGAARRAHQLGMARVCGPAKETALQCAAQVFDGRQVNSMVDDLGRAAEACLGHPPAFARKRPESPADHGFPPRSEQSFKNVASRVTPLPALPTSMCEE